MQTSRVANRHFRTKVGNGSAMFMDKGIDGRTVQARRFQEVFAQIVSDIGGDPTEAQTQIARRAATLAIWAESLEAKLAAGAELDVGAYTTAANSLRRLLADLGLERKAQDVHQHLGSYLASQQSAAPGQSLATDDQDGDQETEADDLGTELSDNFTSDPESVA